MGSDRKHFWRTVGVVVAAVIVVAASVVVWAFQTTSTTSQPGVTIGGPTLSSVVPTPTTSSPPVEQPTSEPPFTFDPTTANKLTPPPSAAPAGCAQDGTTTADWDNQPDIEGVPLGPTDSQSKIESVMVTPGSCFDTVIFTVSKLYNDNPDLNVKFNAAYVDPPNGVMTDGKGDQVNLKGDADLRLTIYAPVEYDYGQQPPFDPWTAYSPSVDGRFQSLQEVRYAGSFEGQTVFGIGVTTKKPFAVEFARDPSSGATLVVLMIAHAG